MSPTVDDAGLVAAAKEGDRAAMDRLLRLHHDRVYAVCRSVVGNDADAADATQNALISVVRGLGRFDGKSAFSTWVYRIATNAAVDELRRRSRRPQPVDHRSGDDRPRMEVGDRPDQSAEGAFQQIEDRLQVSGALAELTDDFRIAVVLRDVADLDYAEIGDVLGIPPGTVRSRIARGRAALARALGTSPPSLDVQSDSDD